MEVPICVSFLPWSKAVLCPYSSKRNSHGCFIPRRKLGLRWRHNSRHFVRITMCSASERESGNMKSGDSHGDSGFIEVLGIGSRKDTVLDFCLNSPLLFSSLRFWNILMSDSEEVQLHQRTIGEDPIQRIVVEAPLFIKSCSKAIILVASAGYGLDHMAAVDIFEAVKSMNIFTVAIVLKPFNFEGVRRQNEVKYLVEKLMEKTNLFIDIDADVLLKKDLVTFDEAVKTANNAVLLATNAISVLVSEMHRKIIDGLHNDVKEVNVSEVHKILKSHKEAKVGFGAGYNIKSSILKSLYDCPFLGVSLKDLNSMVICVLASSVPINDSEVLAFVRAFRQCTDYKREILISTSHVSNLEPNLLITTVFTLGSSSEPQAAQNNGLFSKLAKHFPFVMSFLRGHYQQSIDTSGDSFVEKLSPSDLINSEDFDGKADGNTENGVGDNIDKYYNLINSEDFDGKADGNTENGVGDNIDKYYKAFQPVLSSSNNTELHTLSESAESMDVLFEPLTECDTIAQGGPPSLQREQLINWNLGPGYQMAQEWAKERAADAGAIPMLDKVSIFHLPVGVRPSEELKDFINVSSATQQQQPESENDLKIPVVDSNIPSWSALTDASFGAVREFSSSILKGKNSDNQKKQGVLSIRAASMLEAERDSPKKWSPVMEMQYRGGVYRGRCQGGLPEGKGRLILGDGSMYDGIWHYGKRSGAGTFYFSNGDVFQGSWRDDVMHGKGWFYFNSGERWFANFWKGKANGESRFYTMSGDAFFGNFKNGWRHGDFLCINANGTRCIEQWEHGVLLNCEQLDADAG
ncbi:Protein ACCUMULATION AND REPLICATION OF CHLOROPLASTS 3 [Quillaja saponaria]|uniref:Protein ACCUMULATION AND REPLICATION OF CHLOROPLASTS 3 n=1 Tax=Quillaja saponaria TaxID=32244 RepID=A0AAD7LAA1_QUISA|nr:Protein ACCUMULATION AND REPLICATION OF CHLOROPLASTS 3 [Quillaja saponaria]